MFGYVADNSVLLLAAIGGGLTGLVMGTKYVFTEDENSFLTFLLLPVFVAAGALVWTAGAILGYPWVAPAFIGIIETTTYVIKNPGTFGNLAIIGGLIGGCFGLIASIKKVYEKHDKDDRLLQHAGTVILETVACIPGGMALIIFGYLFLIMLESAFTT